MLDALDQRLDRLVDLVEIAGRERLVTVERDRLGWFDPDSGVERELVELEQGYGAREYAAGPCSRYPLAEHPWEE